MSIFERITEIDISVLEWIRENLYCGFLDAVMPVITFLGMTLADIVAGSLVIEQVFSIPGYGRLLISSISNRDYPVVQAIIAIIAMIVIVINLLVDILYRVLDPRMRGN